MRDEQLAAWMVAAKHEREYRQILALLPIARTAGRMLRSIEPAASDDPVARFLAAGDRMDALRERMSDQGAIRRDVIRELRDRGLSHKQISEQLGISVPRVGQLAG